MLSFGYGPGRASLVAQRMKHLPSVRETRVRSLCREDPLEKEMATHTPVLLPGKFHGQRSLVGYSPWGHEESDTTERLHFHFLLIDDSGIFSDHLSELVRISLYIFFLFIQNIKL